jgi:hypothetical protein
MHYVKVTGHYEGGVAGSQAETVTLHVNPAQVRAVHQRGERISLHWAGPIPAFVVTDRTTAAQLAATLAAGQP